MDFSFTDEQRLLRDSLERFLAGTYGFDELVLSNSVKRATMIDSARGPSDFHLARYTATIDRAA